MKSGRFFVTLSIVFGILAFTTACPNRAREQAGQKAEDQRQAKIHMIQEGNDKIKEYTEVEAELAASYKLNVAKTHGEVANSKFDFMTVNKVQRQEIAGKIARLLQILNRLIEIDSTKNITIDNRENMYAARDSAEAYQKAIEAFEAKNGENFNPKPAARVTEND
jgi:hypothetical protein